MEQRLSALTSLLVGYLQSQDISMSGGRLLFVLSDFVAIQIKKQRTARPKCGKLVIVRPSSLYSQFLFNGGPESQPIAGSMPVNCVRRWLNTNPTLTERMILLHQRLQQSLDG